MNTAIESTTPTVETATVDYKLEVLVIPVSDVDRAKAFYADTLDWRLDADFPLREGWRVIQVTPPGSKASIIFGEGVSDAQPGSYSRLVLAVSDIEVAIADLTARGIEVAGPFVSSPFDRDGDTVPGIDPERTSYKTYASFRDPDGNGWVLQELTTRLPGR
jgi:catechol 2,3-dioxygenase-like lactoylglutathione lyase family enzyme